jgi:tRNA threonylcarbamoyladenosine biosynthesis protein TsaE
VSDAPAAEAPVQRRCADESATDAHGARVGSALHAYLQRETAQADDAMGHRAAFRVHLRGELGAGKTTWTRGALRSLGVPGPVRSPTYALLEPHVAPDCVCVHADLYRLGDASDLETLGLADYDRAGAVWFIEWPERATDRLAAPDLAIDFERDGAQRRIRVEAGSAAGIAVLRGALRGGL